MRKITSRERVRLALNHSQPDRIPNDLGGTIVSSIHVDAYRDLTSYLGNRIDDPPIHDVVQQLPQLDELIREKFKVDFVQLATRPPDSWSLEVEEDDSSFTYVNQWGTTMRMPKRGGRYFDFWEFPVEPNLQSLKDFNWPDPNDRGRFRGLREKALEIVENSGYAICGSPFIGGGILEQAERIMGLEQFLTLMARDSRAADYALGKLTDIYIQVLKNFLGEVGEFIDVVVYWDDIGTQNSLLISPQMYREYVKPKQKVLFDAIRQGTDAKIFFHTDGAIKPLIPDLIEIGADILQPVQVSCKGMGQTEELKREFGDDLVFWGASCDSQHVLPYGSPEDVKEETKRRIRDLKPGGGFVFSPIHNIQPGVPPENIMAMYETFFEYCWY